MMNQGKQFPCPINGKIIYGAESCEECAGCKDDNEEIFQFRVN